MQPAQSGAAIGVVGAGQLAWMLAEAAAELGIAVHVQSPGAAAPAVRNASSVVLAAVDDAAGTAELARRCQAITFENEWLNFEALKPLAEAGVRFLPSLAALEPLVCKRRQRQLLDRLRLPAPRWWSMPAVGELLPDGMTFPLMAKAVSGGYDGKGTALLRAAADLTALQQRVQPEDWILEELVAFELELALSVARDSAGRVEVWSLAQTHQHSQVCDWVLTPVAVPHAVQAYARNIACSLVTALDYVGVLAIEFFYGPAGLQVNEIAPRTHNSAHVTIEAARTSQFTQQARIVANWPLASTELQVPGALMVNLLGFQEGDVDYQGERQALAALPGAAVHWYGKQGPGLGRKLGHVTLVLDGATPEARQGEAMERLEAVRAIWPLPPESA
ncbi:MAG: 5-(carboxyamino)imidazole ribonucleotide synthase [Cyanobacteriota bacterium]|nr:5-(carboxyamino)imidazole ribonucleotide synthase [Cyanobacteriota bacterium]